MPVSNDNQDYNNEENKDKKATGPEPTETKMTSDDLKGKKVDGDPEKESDKPADV